MAVPSGSLQIARVGGVPVSLHWSVALMVVAIVLISGFDLVYSLCSLVAYLLLLAVHEFGHFGAARYFRLEVYEVHFRALDAHCRIEAPRTIREALCVFSAGVVAQAAVLAVTVFVFVVFDPRRGPVADSAFRILGILNVLMIVDNLWPSRTSNGLMSDGYVLRHVLRQARLGVTSPFEPIAPVDPRTRLFPPNTRLLSVGGFVPLDFTHGIEILNDETTPMDFVVGTLMRNLQLSRTQAIEMMLTIHQDGGILHPMQGPDVAAATAAAIAGDAALNGHALVCRAVDATTQLEPAAQ